MKKSLFSLQILLVCCSFSFFLLGERAYAQCGPCPDIVQGIPLASVLLNLAIVVTLYTLVIRFLKERKLRAIAGIGILLVGMLIIGVIIPIDLKSSMGGPIDQYCGTPCNTINPTEYDLIHHPVLKFVLESDKIMGDNNCCAHITINYYDELAMSSIINQATKDYTGMPILQYNGAYYRISVDHIDYHTYTYPNTFFAEDVVFWNLIVSVSFYAIIWETQYRYRDINDISRLHKLLDWIASRRISIAGIAAAVFVILFIALLGLGVGYHDSSYVTLLAILVGLGIYAIVIAIFRFLIRRQQKMDGRKC